MKIFRWSCFPSDEGETSGWLLRAVKINMTHVCDFVNLCLYECFCVFVVYSQGVVLYFLPSVFRCILLRWVRMLGFATVYGTITLKLYRYGHTCFTFWMDGQTDVLLRDYTS